MNLNDFTYLLHHPEQMDNTLTNDIEAIIKAFPYFQSARAIYLKNLKNENSFNYNKALKVTAAYTTDRSILFDFITTQQFSQNTVSEYIKQNLEYIKTLDVTDVDDLSVSKNTIVDNDLEQHIQDIEPSLNPDLFKQKEQHNEQQNTDLLNVDPNGIEHLEEVIEVEQDSKNEHSFSEWLKMTRFNPLAIKPTDSNDKEDNLQDNPQENQDELPSSENTPSNTEKLNKFEIINQFIANNPKIPPIKQDGKTHNIAKAQMLKPKSLMTETLATIYVKQKNYAKAIQAYEFLSLKYPEKSSFFADRIQEIKELQK